MKRKLSRIVLAALISILVISPQTSQAQDVENQFDAFHGYVDGIQILQTETCSQLAIISGWALMDEREGRSDKINSVRFFIDDEFVGMTLGKVSRSDIAAVYGEEYRDSGFNWTIPTKYYDGQTHVFEVRANLASSNWQEDHGVWSNDELIGNVTFNGDNLGITSSIDYVDGEQVIGWAVDLDSYYVYDTQLPVVAYVENSITGHEVMIGQGIADLERADVTSYYSEYSCAIGSHGFNFELNPPGEMSEGDIDELRVYVLNASEQVITEIASYGAEINELGQLIIEE